MSYLVFLILIFFVVAILAGFMASLVYAPTMSLFVRRGYDGRPRFLGRS